ncbi:hypothetical protein OCOJLMKI_5110 [Methylobacterium iners]|uniref:Uncharacterized protein n=1 Tax=Methylobacterium iners TaxID=418707 RepID=A0ABQ4S482_9HYPH|nr:hypothetical protein OCOJLMKI_5110 [Methylobacterium iners]
MEGGLVWLSIIGGIGVVSLLALGIVEVGRRKRAAEGKPSSLDEQSRR